MFYFCKTPRQLKFELKINVWRFVNYTSEWDFLCVYKLALLAKNSLHISHSCFIPKQIYDRITWKLV